MLNIRELVKPMVEQGIPAKDIFAAVKKQHPTAYRAPVYRAIKKLGGKLSNWKPTEGQKKSIEKMIKNGLKLSDIASLIGVTEQQICNLNYRQLKVTSPYVTCRRINRDMIPAEELESLYLVVLRTMMKRFSNYSEDIPSAVGDAIIELQNKPKSDNPYRECFGIAQRRLIDQLRARKGRTGSRRQEIKIGGFAEDFEPAANSDCILETEDEISWLRSRIAGLAESDRQAIQTYLDTNLNYAATARVLGVSEPTAAKYVQAAIQRLREEVNSELLT